MGWSEFIRWAGHWYTMVEYDESERYYKKELIAKSISKARHALLNDDPDWVALFKSLFKNPPNNLISGWRASDQMKKWAANEPEKAKGAFRILWQDIDATDREALLKRLEAFFAELPDEVLHGRGIRLNVASVLLLCMSPELVPTYRDKLFRSGLKAVGMDRPSSSLDEVELYGTYLDFLDEFIQRARACDLAVADRLDAQSLLYSIFSEDPLPSWTAREQVDFLLFQGKTPSEVLQVEATLEGADEHPVDPTAAPDTRERIRASIVARRGQSEFRRRLLVAYKERCAITGCEVKTALEAAHIVPYRGEETNHVSNGLLLRADLHTLFDTGLLRINPEDSTVVLAKELRGDDGHYAELHGQALELPSEESDWPHKAALKARWEDSGA